MSRTDLDLGNDQARQCDWHYFAASSFDRIKTNFSPAEEDLLLYAVPGSPCRFMAAFRSRFPAKEVEVSVSSPFLAELFPVYNVVFPEEASLVPDRLGEEARIPLLPANTAGAFLIQLSVPENFAPGSCEISLELSAACHKKMTCKLSLEILPRAGKTKKSSSVIFWPHWEVFAKRFSLTLWSDDFFEKAAPYLEAMRDLGMTGIMASIVHDPFHYPLPEAFYEYNHYPAMIRWIREDDGSWHFDYTVYDRYVQWNMDHGISGEIECHSLLPCKNQAPELAWYDSAGQFHTQKTAFDAPEYRRIWQIFLRDFMDHNRQKGWEKLITICPYDEPTNPESFISAARLIREYASPARVTAAVGTEKAVSVIEHIDIATLHLDSGYSPENETLLRQNGVELRWYNCCFPDWGNTLFNCTLAEAYRMAFITEAGGYTGFLRWSIFDWPESVMTDPAFNWPTGDAFWLYPGKEKPVYSLRAIAWLEGRTDLQLLLDKALQDPALEKDIQNFIRRLGRRGKLSPNETIPLWKKEIACLLKR